MELLDIGCGTGSLVVDAAKAGARVTGVDISKGMLAVAQKRIVNNRMEDRITLYNAGVVEIGSFYKENSFTFTIDTLYQLGLEEQAKKLEDTLEEAVI